MAIPYHGVSYPDAAGDLEEFTIRHLEAFISTIWDDEREGFRTWVISALVEDSTLADLGWPALLNAYRRERMGR